MLETNKHHDIIPCCCCSFARAAMNGMGKSDGILISPSAIGAIIGMRRGGVDRDETQTSSARPNRLSPMSPCLDPIECILHFKRGVEDANKFLPKPIELCVDLKRQVEERLPPPPPPPPPPATGVGRGEEQGSRKRSSTQKRVVEEGEGRKLLVTQSAKEELSALIDGLFLDQSHSHDTLFDREGQQKNEQQKQQSFPGHPELLSRVMKCVQALASDDRVEATKLLSQIRQHSTPFGYGLERAAHYFANGLEARLDPNTITTVPQLALNMTPRATNLIKVTLSFNRVCPFRDIGLSFMSHQVLKHVQHHHNNRALHLIDLGIYTGVKWTQVIQGLLARQGGPPKKLRITGVVHPQRNLGKETTGQRLIDYCKRYRVPFEFTKLLKKWESIEVEDLKMEPSEATVVVSLPGGLDKLRDEVDADTLQCPRDAVMSLISKINPDMFILSVNIGPYNVPSFLERSKRAFYHYATLFDMFESCFPADKGGERLMLERGIYGRELTNIIACEGSERVEGTDTYAKWHSRTLRAGFQPLPLDEGMVMRLKEAVKDGYHKEYMVEEDGNWLVQGWKGQALCAMCCCIPSP